MKKIMFILLLTGSGLLTTPYSEAQGKSEIYLKDATKNNGYTALNAGETIVIYKYQHASHPPKAAEQYQPKYYFVTGNNTVLQPLTKDNLKAAYPNNHKFHDALDATFKDDKGLYEYDSFHKMYKINHLLIMNQ